MGKQKEPRSKKGSMALVTGHGDHVFLFGDSKKKKKETYYNEPQPPKGETIQKGEIVGLIGGGKGVQA